MQRLVDRVAVITGAGSGIGLASARRLAAEGARIVAVDIDGETGKAAATEAGGIFVQADVTSEDDVRGVYETAAREFGRIDIAFNNAGISPPEDDSILVTGLDAWRRVQEVNLTSVYLCCKHVIPHMRRAGGGSIINTASFVAILGAATSQISYTASKGGVLAMSRELRRARGDRRRRGVPGQRRRLVRHRVDVPGGWRHLRCVCDAAVDWPDLRSLSASSVRPGRR
jgi:NAD(P)-dependent dehydrogenase (short-subunit alcohol dehydrogenase family)